MTIGSKPVVRRSPSRVELLRYWLPVAGWMLCISMFSGDPFSAANTHHYIDPILNFFFPELSPAGFALAHTIVRKLAHFTEFFILGWLSYGALRRNRRPAWQLGLALRAALLAAAFSLVDELHQAFVPSRTPSILDSAIDASGAATAQLVRYLRDRLSATWKRSA